MQGFKSGAAVAAVMASALSIGGAQAATAEITESPWLAETIAVVGPYLLHCEIAPVPGSAGRFGGAVSVWHDGTSGIDWMAVGAPAENSFAGAVHIYSLAPAATSWHEEARLIADDATASSAFGYSVAIDHDTVVVGAPWHVADFSIGAVYVYVRDEATGAWTQQGDELTTASVNFGFAVALKGDDLTASDPILSDVVTYSRTGTTWATFDTLHAPSSGALPYFGASLSMDKDRLLIGSPNDGDVARSQGSAALYSKSRDHWDLQQVLRPSAGATKDQQFGNAVAISDDLIVVGAPGATAGKGGAYFFTYDGTTSMFSEHLLLTGGPAAAHSRYAVSVAMSATSVVIGSPLADSVDVFKRKGTDIVIDATLTGDPITFFGASLATTGGKVWVGATGPTSSSDGKVYVFANDRIFADDFE